ncbi:MAG: glycosyltransferase family 25 protein [Pirellulales bacterium]
MDRLRRQPGATTARWETLEARLLTLGRDYERVEAVDGKTLPEVIPEFSELSYKILHGRRRTPAEIGCYLSHIACARRLLESDRSHALIVEDDVEFAPDTAAAIDAALAAADEWDILRLSTVNRGRKFGYAPLIDGRRLAIALTREKGAGGYVINRRAAETFVKRFLPMRTAWDIAFDIEYLYGLRSVFVAPVPIDQNTGMETQIQHNIKTYRMPWWRYFTVFPYRVYLESLRAARRGTRLLWLKWKHRGDVA